MIQFLQKFKLYEEHITYKTKIIIKIKKIKIIYCILIYVYDSYLSIYSPLIEI